MPAGLMIHEARSATLRPTEDGDAIMVGFTARTLLGITVGIFFLIAVLVALIADVFAVEAPARRQKPTQRARNRVQWARS
jgi:hypothetical protein